MKSVMIRIFLASVAGTFINVYIFEFSDNMAAVAFINWNIGAFIALHIFRKDNNLK